MEPVDYLRAMRQRWILIVALTLFGAVAAFATSSGDPAPSYQATHILIQDSSPDQVQVDLARAAFLVTSGEVPVRVAEKLGEDPRQVLDGVTALTDVELNGLRITADEATPKRAAEVSDTFARELIGVLDEKAQLAKESQLKIQRQVVSDLQTQLAAAPPLSLQASAIQDQLSAAQGDLADRETSIPSTSGLRDFQFASPTPTNASTSRAARIAIGAIMGFLLGVVTALVLARFDTRIRTRELAESSFGAPVLAEIPPLKRSLRNRNTIVALADPESLASEGYRGLRTALVVATRPKPPAEDVTRRSSRARRPPAAEPNALVVLVASPGMGEGKTTTSANLGVTFAETGRRVILLGCDFRRPELHHYFGVDEEPGLTDELMKPPLQRSLANIIRDTKVPGLRIVPSGPPVEHPGELLTRGLDLVRSASDLADVVVIDTAPLLATDDASVLLPLADAVVLVCRSGRTSIEAAARARELLDRLGAPLAGLALIGTRQLGSARSYYRVDYRARTRPKKAQDQKKEASVPDPEVETGFGDESSSGAPQDLAAGDARTTTTGTGGAAS